MDTSYFDKVHRDDRLGLPRYEGVTLSAFPPLKKDADHRMSEIKTFRTRKDDVLLCGYVKSGTHWMFEILNMLLSGEPELVEDSKESKTLEMIPDLNIYDVMTSPRLVTTHLQYRFLPEAYRKNGCKIIYIVRNPKDCAVSCYHHFSRSKMSSFLAPDWITLIQNFTSENFMYGGWFKYAKEWRDASESNSSILYLTYEKFKRDPDKHVQKMADFLDLKLSPETIKNIATKCDFEYMKQHKADDSHLFSKDGKPLMYRKGQVGDWKNMFTVTQNEDFDIAMKEELADSSLLDEMEFE